MLKAENLSKKYGSEPAIKNLSFDIEKGEIVGLLGPNGAGKTTTMEICSGLLKQDSGTVEVNQGNIRDKVSVVFQETKFEMKLRVDEFLRLIEKLNGNSYSRNEALKQTGLLEHKKRMVTELSGGLKKRVNLATGLLKDPDFLLLDEPTANLDPRISQEVRKFIKKLSADKGVLISTHSMREAEELCDRVIIIERGEKILSGKPEELLSDIDAKYVIRAEGEVPSGIQNAITSDGFFEVPTDKPHKILRELVESGELEKLENFSVEKPSLEDVYMKATGRRYRDENT